jgi:hypothetical protein
MLRRRRTITAAVIAFAVTAGGVGVTHAAFSSTTSNPTNGVTARPDWLGPTVGVTTIAKTTGYIAGYVKRSGTYRLYADVNEPASNPAAGVASVVANPSAFTAAQTSVALTSTGGPWSVEGVSYNYRSGSLTADAGLAAGAKTWSLVATDAASPSANSTTASSLTGTVDITVPTATSIAAANKAGGTQSKPEIGDTLTFTYSEQIDPESVLTGWTGTSTNVTVQILDGGGGANDILTVWNSANSSLLPLGSINLGRKDYFSGNTTFGAPAAATRSTMTQSGSTITITLGTLGAATAATGAASANMVWTPTATPYDRAGLALSTTPFTESDNDRDF